MKIKFVDFWQGFDPNANFLLEHLRQIGDFTTDDNPDVVIYSCYGAEHRNFKTPRIFFSAENQRADFTACDFAITFDYTNHPRHFRYPLFAVYADIYDWWPKLTQSSSDASHLSAWQSKTKFCCMVVSNGKCKRRNKFFDKLSSVAKVDSGGRYQNNIGGPVSDKLAFIENYRFVISFENSSYPGYTTEKLIEPLITGSIPIYWGNSVLNRDFNTKRFLVADDICNDDRLIDKIQEINGNPSQAVLLLREPVFFKNERPMILASEQLRAFLKMALRSCQTITPVSRKPYSQALHQVKRCMNVPVHYLKRSLGTNFR